MFSQSTLNPLTAVRLHAGPFKQRQDVNAEHLEQIDVDRLLVPFRREAGIDTDAEPYGGWEARSINGHSLGHYLSAVSHLHASTGLPWTAERVTHIVDALAACQRALGGGALTPVSRKVYDDLRAGIVEASPFELNGAWVPNYTLHKVMAGLRDAYRHVGNTMALEVGKGVGDWLAEVLDGLDERQIQHMLSAEHGGMLEVFADLAADTGDDKYIAHAQRFWFHRDVLDPLLQGIDALDGKHGNTQIPKVLGLAKLYELTGNTDYRTAAEFFWECVVRHRSFANGGHGEAEHFFPPEQFPHKLTPMTAETCNTYNLLKLTSHIFAWTGAAEAMDFAERALFNHLLANIGGNPGEFGYFLGLGAVGVKVFSEPCQAWWCCVGTGMENPTRYAELAYAGNDDTLWVNLYLDSEASWKGVTLRQDTALPDDEVVRLTVRCAQPTTFTLNLRHPYWCAEPRVTLNGTALAIESTPSSYLSISRAWNDGDVVELVLPMRLRAETLPYSDGSIIALMHGPTLLAATLPAETPPRLRYSDHLDARGKTDDVPPVMVAVDVDDALCRIEPADAFGTFRTRDLLQPTDALLVPLHKVYDQPYAVYFPWMTQTTWEARREEMAAERVQQLVDEAHTVDAVTPGYQQPEVEHTLHSEQSEVIDFNGHKGRRANAGGFFSYELAVAPDVDNVLVATYWGSQWHSPTFDVLVDEHVIATQVLRADKPGDFYEQTYPIPNALTGQRTKVRVTFRPHGQSIAGPLFGLSVRRVPRKTP